MPRLTLVSHHLCPYVQRAAIALAEKQMPFERLYVDLADKPGWFRALSPLGKVPLLKVEEDGKETVVFESAVILEYLEEIGPNPLHPAGPLARARERAWVEFASSVLDRIAAFYNAQSQAALESEAAQLAAMFERVEGEAGDGPWFAGGRFGLVDAAFAPVFRYFGVFDRIADFGVLDGKPRMVAWRSRLAERASVRSAVAADYPERLLRFLLERGGALSALAVRTAGLNRTAPRARPAAAAPAPSPAVPAPHGGSA